MKKLLIITDSYGEHRYTITEDTSEVIGTYCVTLLNEEPLCYNRREERMESFNGEYWDVYISDSSIIQVDIL